MTLHTEIEINASPEKVWQVLTAFEKYPEWNPMIIRLTGDVAPGKRIEAQLQQPGSKPMTFKPVVTYFEPNQKFSWQGNLVIPGLFDGEHIFELQKLADNRVRFVHRENFKGILIPLFRKMIEKNTRQGFELMNQKLKERAEQ